LVSAVTVPGAMAALDSGARVAQAQKPPNPTTVRTNPASRDRPTGGSSVTVGEGDAMTSVVMTGSSGCRFDAVCFYAVWVFDGTACT
jgi:hypothetical protein